MNRACRRILTLNAGSSSLKFALFEAGDSPRQVLRGEIERIGQPLTLFKVTSTDSKDDVTRPVAAPNHAAAFILLMDWISERFVGKNVDAVGHRGEMEAAVGFAYR